MVTGSSLEYRNQWGKIFENWSQLISVSGFEFVAANVFVSSSNANRSILLVWFAPSVGLVKLNVDATYNYNTKVATCGVVLRDHAGDVLLSAIASFPDVSALLQAEFIAILFGLEVIKSGNFGPMLMESDAAVAIRELGEGLNSLSVWFGYIINMLELARCCRVKGFYHVRRDANDIARKLSKMLYPVGGRQIWVFTLPSSDM
ncbi:hypothetical protein PTKIN_Ptkin07bG0000400 [Pterospermum kingtungense]